jgi:ATP-dependent DNA ligase
MTSIPEFPTLYGDSSHGKQKTWSVTVTTNSEHHGIITSTHGYVDSKQTASTRIVTEGKNLGKKNATTPLTQAISEAQALWNKKRDAGYTTSATAAATGTDDGAVGGAGGPSTDVPLPMLAHDYNKRAKSIQFPCFAQRKLDGVRCIAIPGRGLYSRNGKRFPHLEHIQTEVGGVTLYLDGELYSDELTFQEIVGLVKKEKLTPADHTKMQKMYLYVYDCVLPTKSYAERKTTLDDLFAKHTFTYLRLLPTAVCSSVDDVKKLHADYVAEGYEGLILRQSDGLYKVGHRSTDLQKYKEFFDSEYRIVGYKQGDGEEKGCVIWLCHTPRGQEFAVRPRGTRAERSELFTNGDKYVGKLLTVRYQELTTDGIPRFPVGITFRDYE